VLSIQIRTQLPIRYWRVSISENPVLVMLALVPVHDVREDLAFAISLVLDHDSAVFVKQVSRLHCFTFGRGIRTNEGQSCYRRW